MLFFDEDRLIEEASSGALRGKCSAWPVKSSSGSKSLWEG